MKRTLASMIAGGAAAMTLTTLAAPASAEQGRVAIDWGKLMLGVDAYARGKGDRESPRASSADKPLAAAERFGQPLAHNAGNPWFGVAPSVSFVARDWGSAFRLAGDRLSLVDALRLSESTRMVMTRVRLSNSSRVTPFAQVGFGQWRTDTNIMRLTPRMTELATSVGVGFELQIMDDWQAACEVGGTLFIRDEREVSNIPETKLWSAMIASRLAF